MNESLSIPDMHREFTLKALNTSCCHIRAAIRLGLDERTLYHWKKIYRIIWDPVERQYVIAETEKNLHHA